MSSSLTTFSDRAQELDSSLDTPETTNRLETFPPTATIARANSEHPESEATHIASHVGEEGVTVIVAVHCLIDDRDGLRAVTKGSFAKRVKILVLTGRPAYMSQDWLQKLVYAKTVGGADTVHTPSHELAVLLGIEGKNRALRNGIMVIHNGTIVWRSIVDAKKPDHPHDTNGLTEAIERYLK